jgi:hypothetical protein
MCERREGQGWPRAAEPKALSPAHTSSLVIDGPLGRP